MSNKVIFSLNFQQKWKILILSLFIKTRVVEIFILIVCMIGIIVMVFYKITLNSINNNQRPECSLLLGSLQRNATLSLTTSRKIARR